MDWTFGVALGGVVGKWRWSRAVPGKLLIYICMYMLPHVNVN